MEGWRSCERGDSLGYLFFILWFGSLLLEIDALTATLFVIFCLSLCFFFLFSVSVFFSSLTRRHSIVTYRIGGHVIYKI